MLLNGALNWVAMAEIVYDYCNNSRHRCNSLAAFIFATITCNFIRSTVCCRQGAKHNATNCVAGVVMRMTTMRGSNTRVSNACVVCVLQSCPSCVNRMRTHTQRSARTHTSANMVAIACNCALCKCTLWLCSIAACSMWQHIGKISK